MSPELSVIIPIKNEMSLGYLDLILESYSVTTNIELIWVSGDSADGSVEYLKSKNQNIIETNINSRGGRLNKGINAAKSNYILLNHPRSVLSLKGINNLLSQFKKEPLIWGGFTHKFNNFNHWLLNFTSYYSNEARFDKRGIVYLDHCIFFNKGLLGDDKAPVPEVDIFEDTLFSKKLLKIKKPIRLPQYSTTSPVRFEKNGVYKQSYLNQKLKWQLYFGKSLTQMNKKYEKGLDLNSNY